MARISLILISELSTFFSLLPQIGLSLLWWTYVTHRFVARTIFEYLTLLLCGLSLPAVFFASDNLIH